MQTDKKNGVIAIDIEIKKRNRAKEFFHKFQGKAEDIIFSTVQKLPEKFIPRWLMNWLSRYLDRRIRELKQESIKMTWQKMYLQEVVDDMRKSK